ncbi:MAG TPA: TonB-dependent receptor [Anaeromyxobacteraceae bacterium]|nr:TonB-dependent receptor [Anaeromyxobacteraceae bacterium]
MEPPEGGSAASRGPGQLSPDQETITLPEVLIDVRQPGKVLNDKLRAFEESRGNFLLPALGANASSLTRSEINSLPQGLDTPIDNALTQLPGVSVDAATSNVSYHVRSEYANVQYRINGIQLPDGLSGFGQIVETGFVGTLRLLDGALPAQYGLRTAGVIDIAARNEYPPSGSVTFFGGSYWTLSPSIAYGGQTEDLQYFVAGRYLRSDEGLDNAMPTYYPLHDRTEQWKAFGYLSGLVGESSRLTYLAGMSLGWFQIPNVIGQAPAGDFGSPTYPSANLNENQYENFTFNVLALQTKGQGFETQVSLFARYALVHFLPDVYGDLVFNNVASNVKRQSCLIGLQGDTAWRLGASNTLRAGFGIASESTQVDNLATVLPLDASGSPLPYPVTINDYAPRIGWNLGAFVQDEWNITSALTLNAGLRFDQMYQYVVASQVSPRVALLVQVAPSTTLHAAYARYFTPPVQVEATPTNLALFQNTTLQPAIGLQSPVQPERSHYFDVGVDSRPLAGLRIAASAYYKLATNLLDDGQFGEATVLSQLNYARAYSEGLELSLGYEVGGLRAYGNLALNATKAKGVASNQYLFDPEEFAYLGTHYHVTDDAQTVTASAGVSYSSRGFLASCDFIHGSGLPSGFANTEHVPGYAIINVAVANEFDPWTTRRPLVVRLSVANLLDTAYVLRSGTGVGQFAPQYGPRRGIFVSFSQKI